MASTPSTAEIKKPSSMRARRTTPRPRVVKSAAAEKKAPPPRRRASPRNLRKTQDSELERMQKDTRQEKEEEETVEPPQPPATQAPPTDKDESEQEQQRIQTSQEAVDKTEADNQQESAAEEETELPPAHDTQLRRTYLQRIYRQLQSTHPNQDDTVIRQIATNMEMEACQKAATRSQYVTAMEQEIHQLMQFEMEQANASVFSNDAQGLGNMHTNTQAQPADSGEVQGGYSQHQISQSRNYEYAQALAKAQEQEQATSFSRSSSFSTPRQSMSGRDTSFQSLMGNQTPGYPGNSMQQQQHNTPNRVMSMQNLQQLGNGGNQFYSTSSMTPPPTSQSFSIASNVNEMTGQGTPRNMMEAHQQQRNFQMQQQRMQQSGPVRPQSRVTNFQEFSAQIQHLDKSVLIELLWNQRGALARWQNQAKQLELQLSTQRSASTGMSSPGFNSPYNSGGGSFGNPNVSAEAEMQRARDRNNSRMAHQQQMPAYSYGQQSNFTSDNYAQVNGNWGENPQQYWERIRALKATYEDKLRTAQRALAHNTAPPNSVYSAKAQSMMQNIGLVLNILNEQPTNMQPRKLEVLNSIERFMQMSVLPIVQKVLSSGSQPQMTTGSQALVASGSSAVSVATYSPGLPPARDNTFGMDSNSGQGTDNQYGGTRWASSSSIFNGEDTSRQSSRGVFPDAEPKSSTGNDVSTPTMNAPTQMMDGLSAVGNSPSSDNEEYEDSNYAPENDNKVANHQAESSQNRVYEAPTMTPKGICASLPAIESRPSSIPETRLPSLSPGDNARDSNNKVMEGNVDDTLNEFSELADMDFGDPVVENSILVKENNTSNVLRKRGIEDV